MGVNGSIVYDADSTNVVANGISSSKITITVPNNKDGTNTDVYKNYMNKNVKLTSYLSPVNGTVVNGIITYKKGNAISDTVFINQGTNTFTFTVTDIIPETVILIVEMAENTDKDKDGVSGLALFMGIYSKPITFTKPVISSTYSSISSNTTKVNANGTSSAIISVTLKDTTNSPLSGYDIKLSPSANTSSSINPSNEICSTDSNGVALFSVTDTVPEIVTYTAKYLNNSINSIPITFSNVSTVSNDQTILYIIIGVFVIIIIYLLLKKR